MNNHQHRNKILEELQKKHLRQSSSSSSATSQPSSSTSSSNNNPSGVTISSSSSSSSIVSNGIISANGMATAAQIISGIPPSSTSIDPTSKLSFHSNPNSFGYFISQDSPFGNNILPILPRF